MKEQGWADILGTVCKKLLGMLAHVLVFIAWVVLSAVEVLLHDLNVSMKKFLFPHKE